MLIEVQCIGCQKTFTVSPHMNLDAEGIEFCSACRLSRNRVYEDHKFHRLLGMVLIAGSFAVILLLGWYLWGK